MTNLERQDAKGQVLLPNPVNYVRVLWPRMTKIDTVTQVVEMRVSVYKDWTCKDKDKDKDKD